MHRSSNLRTLNHVIGNELWVEHPGFEGPFAIEQPRVLTDLHRFRWIAIDAESFSQSLTGIDRDNKNATTCSSSGDREGC